MKSSSDVEDEKEENVAHNISIFDQSARMGMRNVLKISLISLIIIFFKVLISTNVLYGYAWNTVPNTLVINIIAFYLIPSLIIFYRGI